MRRFLSRRLLLALVTLWLLATIVFVITNILPNDVGRTILTEEFHAARIQGWFDAKRSTHRFAQARNGHDRPHGHAQPRSG